MNHRRLDRYASHIPHQESCHIRTRLKKGILQTLLCTFLITLVTAPASAEYIPETEEQKVLYALGLSVARSLSAFDLTPDELKFVQRGMTDHIVGAQPDPDLLDYGAKIKDFARERRKALGARQSAAGREFLERAAKEKGAVKTSSGLVYTALREGNGASPKADDVVKMHYRGTLSDGREFESSYKRGRPLEFRLENVIKCWIEGMQMMKPGGRARLVCPPNLAYSDSGVGEKVPPGATLAFEVELLEVNPVAAPAPGRAAPELHAAPTRK